MVARTVWGRGLFALVAVTMLGAGGYRITPSTNRILPAAPDAMKPGTELTVAKGDVIYRQAVGAAYRATLLGEVKVTIAGQSWEIPSGAMLNVALVDERSAERLDGNRAVFCAPPRNNWNTAKGLANLATLGLFATAQRHSASTQLCLIDSEKDGKADKAILAGANREEDRQAVAIEPVGIMVEADAPLPGLSEARLRFIGKAGIFGNLAVDLEIVENGQMLGFSNGRVLVPAGKLPQTVRQFGATLTILSYDEATKTARIRLESPFEPLEYQIQTTTTYIPIYIPG